MGLSLALEGLLPLLCPLFSTDFQFELNDLEDLFCLFELGSDWALSSSTAQLEQALSGDLLWS